MDVNTAPTGTTVEQAAERIKALFSAPVVDEAMTVAETETGNAESTDETAADQPVVRTFKVKVDGEEIEVPEDEVLKGYSRTADYTRKTQKLSEEKKQLEFESQTVKAERERYLEGLKLIESQFRQEDKVDWARLREEDPIAYATKKIEERDRKDQLALIQQEQHRVATLQADDQRRALETYVQAEQAKLADALPEWKDAKVAKAEKEKLSGYLQGIGYSEAEISQIYDHRAVITVRKAALYDEMMSKAKAQTEKVSASPKTARPGNLQSSSSQKQFAQAKDTLRTKGDINSFVAAFNALNRK